MRFGETTATLERIPKGVDGVKITLERMRSFVRNGKKDIQNRLLAMRLVSGLTEKDWKKEIITLHKYVRDNIRYLKDIRGIETLQTPIKTIELGQGDCDDKSTLLATLLETIGHPTRFVAVSLKRNPSVFCHVYVQTKIGRKWVSLETTEKVRPGWEPPDISKRLIINN